MIAGEGDGRVRTQVEFLAMSDVGLVRFAEVALEVTSRVIPLYRARSSKHIFTQPQLLAVLLLMRFEGWTFRDAETRLGEHSELREALGLASVPDHTTLYRFMRRVENEVLDDALARTAERLPSPESGGRSVDAEIAVDGTGLDTCSVSSYFVKRTGAVSRRHYLKWVVSVDTAKLMITAQMAHRGPTNDTASLPGLVEKTRRAGPIGLVLADAEFDSRHNHDYIRGSIGAMSVIPATRNKVKGKAHGVRAEMQKNFPAQLYARRALIETVFSMVKRKLSARAPGRSLTTQRLQAMLLGVAFNVYRLRPRQPTRGNTNQTTSPLSHPLKA